MIDVVFPSNNENDFIKIAERLGVEGLLLVYASPKDISEFQSKTKLKLSVGILCKPEDVRKYKGKYTTLVRAPEEQDQIRTIIENHKPDILFGLEFSRRKDFMHHRASGLNHILAVLAKEKGVSIGFSFSEILQANQHDRAVFIGRMMQNLMFAKKFEFKTITGSFSKNCWLMRGDKDIKSLISSFGSVRDNSDIFYEVGCNV